MALSARKMDELLHQIELSVQTIRAHLAETEKAATGGSHETTADPLESASDTVKNERLQLFEATKSLQQLLSGPYHIWEQCSVKVGGQTWTMIVNWNDANKDSWLIQGIHVASIPQLLPMDASFRHCDHFAAR